EDGQRDTGGADVRAGGAVPSGTGDHERSDRVIGIDGGDDLGDGTPHRAGERIALLGPIDDEGSDPTGDCEVETLVIDRTVGTVSGHMLRSEEQTSELQSRFDIVCRLLHEKKKQERPAVYMLLLVYK